MSETTTLPYGVSVNSPSLSFDTKPESVKRSIFRWASCNVASSFNAICESRYCFWLSFINIDSRRSPASSKKREPAPSSGCPDIELTIYFLKFKLVKYHVLNLHSLIQYS